MKKLALFALLASTLGCSAGNLEYVKEHAP